MAPTAARQAAPRPAIRSAAAHRWRACKPQHAVRRPGRPARWPGPGAAIFASNGRPARQARVVLAHAWGFSANPSVPAAPSISSRRSDMPRERRKIGDLLCSAGVVTEAQLEEALVEQKSTGELIG